LGCCFVYIIMNAILENTYKELRTGLKSFISSRINDKSDAEDILHDVFLKAHNNIDSLKDISKLNGWIYSIARNTITDHYRTRKIAVNIDDYDLEDETEEITALKKLEPSVRSLVRLLPPAYREAIVLVDFKGMTQTSLAEKLGLSVSAAKSRVQRARKMLKDLFLECCHFELNKSGAVIDYHSHYCSKGSCG
jgi:RNA polymerase sigma-70 factor, ECF subfamily